MNFDRSRLRWPEWTVGAGSVLLLAAMLLLPWYEFTASTPPPGPQYFITYSVDGWNGLQGARWLILVTILLGLALVFFQATRRAPAIPVTLSLFVALLGGIAVLWLIYRVPIDPPGGRDLGGWIGLIAACAIAYGGYKSLRREGIASADGPKEIATVKLGEQSRT
jgi:hypothetical protein